MRPLLTLLLIPACFAANIVMVLGESEYGSTQTMSAFASELREAGHQVTLINAPQKEAWPGFDLAEADLLMLFLRFREPTAAEFAALDAWFAADKPAIALRTTSHAFSSVLERKAWFPGVFGGHYLGHAPNGQGTITLAMDHPIADGVDRLVEMGHGGTYNAGALDDDCQVVLLGKTGDLPAEPVAWTKAPNRFYTSLGSQDNFKHPTFRKLLHNAVDWCLKPKRKLNLSASVDRPSQIPDGAIAIPAEHWTHYDVGGNPKGIRIDERASTLAGRKDYHQARWQHFIARPGFGDIVTHQAFANYELHLDFILPEEGDHVALPFRGNSGVFIHGSHEIAIADSAGQPLSAQSMGAIAGHKAPLADAAKGPGVWQSLDITVSDTVSVWLNGTLVQDRVKLDKPTAHGFLTPWHPPTSGNPDEPRHAYSAAESAAFDFGDGNFRIKARFRTKKGGAIAAKAPAEGPWAPGGKVLFVRGGKLGFDIGWEGVVNGKTAVADGEWHEVELISDDGQVTIVLDGKPDGKGRLSGKDGMGHVLKVGSCASTFMGDFQGEIAYVDFIESAGGSPATLSWRPAGSEARVEPPAPLPYKGLPGTAGPIRLQADSSAVRFANIWIRPLGAVDHAGILGKLDDNSLAGGKAIYDGLCVVCHGTIDKPGSLPTALRFGEGQFKNGHDPYSMYRTITEGFGQMVAQSWMAPQQVYDVVHYIREAYLKPHNPSQYTTVTPDYLAGLPKGASIEQPQVEKPKIPHNKNYLYMDYGPNLNWTYQVEPGNIAYKAIAIRLDSGPGGVSKGKNWLLFDHDLMRVAAIWSGDEFVDWRGIAFDGSHGTHTSIKGKTELINPLAPGFANPATGSWDDPRFLGKDNKPYGPLPRDWARYRGLYHYGDKVILEYEVGGTRFLDMPTLEDGAVVRHINHGPIAKPLQMRLSPGEILTLPAGPAGKLKIGAAGDALDLQPLLQGTPVRWPQEIRTQVERAKDESAAYVVDDIRVPYDNPWNSWMRVGGFDFYPDGDRAIVATWMGDVWRVKGLLREGGELSWRRIGGGLFQPLGVKIVKGQIYVGCRDQIVRLHDLNGDEEIDYYEAFNADHQVTEHFHEFAMGLQADDAGNFYYAKSARHAKDALVPHHGTLLKVSADGGETEILATGFRAANGVCINPDGSFFVTDQEGHWTPKNRVNWVTPGGYYGNFMGYHDHSDSDEDMEQPLAWLTNRFNRSPGELLWVDSEQWGPLSGALLDISYGMGQVFVVPHEKVAGQLQGGECALPIPLLPTGAMRGRFHPSDGQLYIAGLFAWAANRNQQPGGFYRVRWTGKPVYMPSKLEARKTGVVIHLSDPILAESATSERFTVKAWDLKRGRNYGSKHYNERELKVGAVTLSEDGRRLTLDIADFAPTWCMSIACKFATKDGDQQREIHNTVHNLGQ
jgi:mono/diheme cytochrome c family protein